MSRISKQFQKPTTLRTEDLEQFFASHPDLKRAIAKFGSTCPTYLEKPLAEIDEKEREQAIKKQFQKHDLKQAWKILTLPFATLMEQGNLCDFIDKLYFLSFLGQEGEFEDEVSAADARVSIMLSKLYDLYKPLDAQRKERFLTFLRKTEEDERNKAQQQLMRNFARGILVTRFQDWSLIPREEMYDLVNLLLVGLKPTKAWSYGNLRETPSRETRQQLRSIFDQLTKRGLLADATVFVLVMLRDPRFSSEWINIELLPLLNKKILDRLVDAIAISDELPFLSVPGSRFNLLLPAFEKYEVEIPIRAGWIPFLKKFPGWQRRLGPNSSHPVDEFLWNVAQGGREDKLALLSRLQTDSDFKDWKARFGTDVELTCNDIEQSLKIYPHQPWLRDLNIKNKCLTENISTKMARDLVEAAEDEGMRDTFFHYLLSNRLIDLVWFPQIVEKATLDSERAARVLETYENIDGGESSEEE